MTQFYSRIDVNYSGDVYSIPFDYIDKKEIKVYIDNELWTKWHFIQQNQLTLDDVPENIAYANIISIRRETNIEEKVVDYNNNSLLNKENLNKSQDQLLYAVQEIYDNNIQNNIDIKAEVDEKVEKVSDAVEQLHVLDETVMKATEQATIATQQATIATQQSELVSSTANKALEDIDTLRTNTINELDTIVEDSVETVSGLANEITNNAQNIINRLGINLFDTKVSDHILEGEEALGWALQGTYVEKADYPDFYDECLEQYENGTESFISGNPIVLPTFTANTTNGITVSDARGNTDAYTLINGVSMKAIGLWNTYWFNIDYNQDTIINSYTIKADNNGSPEYPSAWTLQGSNNGTDFEVIDTQSGITFSLAESKTFTVTPNKAYKQYRLVFSNGVTSSNNGELGKLSFDVNSAIKMVQNPNGHRFYDITNKSVIDTYYAETGIADFYGIDTENERVFLPRENGTVHGALIDSSYSTSYWYRIYEDGWCEQGGTSNAGKVTFQKPYLEAPTVEVALRNSTSYTPSLKNVNSTTTGFSWEGQYWSNYQYAGAFTASIYWTAQGKVDVPNANENVTRLKYYCVGNTEVKQAISNVTEITTTENDTIPLFTGLYFDFKPNNASWLKGGEQKNRAGLYETTYDELVECLTGVNKYDLKVINIGDMVAGVDYSEYWKLDQDNMVFQTPTAISNKALSGAVVGNGMALGVTDGTNSFALNTSTISNASSFRPNGNNYGKEIGNINSSYTDVVYNSAIGVTTDPTKSGIVAEQSTAQLYFKVANAVQNLELLNVGEVTEALADKVDYSDTEWATGACMPDYSSVVTVTYPLSSKPYTAPCSGMLCLWGKPSNTAIRPIINGVKQEYLRVGELSGGSGGFQGRSIYLSKGDVIYFDNSYGTFNGCVFYPLKGVKQ